MFKGSSLPALALLALGATGWLGRAGAADKSPTKGRTTAAVEVEMIRDLPYDEGSNADPVKHRLDLFLPKGKKDFPVLFFVHGGGWRHGDKSFLGLYSTLGMFWARHGVGAVVTNYRLTPAVRHPGHIRDVARAFAWTYKNIARYGGRPDQIFASGHSAGGHLVSLLATNDAFLRAEGLELSAIRGVIPVSGVYDVNERLRLFDVTFGTEPEARREASPVNHVRRDAPPFLIVYGDNDFPQCGREPSERFCQALKEKNCEARTLEVKRRNHFTILLQAVTEADPVAQAVLEFIADRIQ
jgi:acetyl esterase/lipase